MMLSASVNMFAQDDQLDSLNFEVTPVVEEKPPYFALGGGYSGTFFFINMDELNKHFTDKAFNIGEIKSNIYVSGAQGFTAIGVVPNLRIGFFGVSGSTKSETGNDTLTTGAEVSVGFTGFSLDYGFLPFKSLAILPGISFGWADMTIESYKTQKEFDFNNYPASCYANNYLDRADGAYYFVQPAINIEYAVTPFLMARINAHYVLPFSGEWKFNRNADLKNVPSKVQPGGFGLQFGIFVGLFNY